MNIHEGDVYLSKRYETVLVYIHKINPNSNVEVFVFSVEDIFIPQKVEEDFKFFNGIVQQLYTFYTNVRDV